MKKLLELIKDKGVKLEEIFYGFLKNKNIYIIKYQELE